MLFAACCLLFAYPPAPTPPLPHSPIPLSQIPMINEESYVDFLCEAQELLKNIEQELLTLKDDPAPAKIHSLMRSAHTLKGAAASVGLETIQKIAHVLEDVFKNLYKPEVVIDDEIETLLIQGYECLRLPLMAHFNGGSSVNESLMLDRAASVIAKLQEKLGDCFERDAPLPNSAELGFDVVKSMFEKGVEEKLQEIEAAGPQNLETVLRQKAEVFIGLAESFGLPGFRDIALSTLDALDAHPDRLEAITKLALEDFRQGQKLILAGDRERGGSPSPALEELAEKITSTDFSPQINLDVNTENQLVVFQQPAEIEVSSTEISNQIEETAIFSEEVGLEERTITMSSKEEDFDRAAFEPEKSTAPPIEPINSTLSLNQLFANADVNTDSYTEEIKPEKDKIQTPSFAKKTKSNSETSKINSLKNSGYKPPKKDSKLGSVRVALEQLERLNHIAGELLINQNQQYAQDEQLRLSIQELIEHFRQHQQSLNELLDWSDRKWSETEKWSENRKILEHNSPLTNSFDTLEMDRYSDLQLLVKKAIDETLHLETLAEGIGGLAKQSRLSREAQERLLTHVRDDLTTARMQPLGDLLNRLPPLLKQLTKTHNKKAELALLGTEVLVDKAIVEKLYDPLLHLVRNAFDHGIEPPDIRKSNRKPEIGRIEIKAYHQGNRTTIEVKDDGRGIDLQKIARRAGEMGLTVPDRLSRMSESELLDFLFEPGFSTASKLTELSGRGVGLDIVRSQLQEINGSVNISSTLGVGTTFSLNIPLSLTVTKLLVCKATGVSYALPVESVEQILIPQDSQIGILGKNFTSRNQDRSQISLETNLDKQKMSKQIVLRWQQGEEEIFVPIHKLSELVEYSAISSRFLGNNSNSALIASEGLLTQHSPVILLRTSEGLTALQVEQILGEKELVLRPLPAAINPAPYIYGCCILSSSKLALAIDIEKLIDYRTTTNKVIEHREAINSAPLLSPSSSASSVAKNLDINSQSPSGLTESIVLLVVDDSLTLRRGLTRTLEKFGYQVCQAADGQEALELLQQKDSVNLIVCDVEMPRLNGFELLNKLRVNSHLSNIPVVMLTSRSGAKYRQIASELGASAYLTKPYSENELLSIITDILK
ncbi:MAG: response regulator [Prochloraceae cyanobacterium]|nr:response regulator [Prochloraceae cyanobacterium]